jgi:hypothetical protein
MPITIATFLEDANRLQEPLVFLCLHLVLVNQYVRDGEYKAKTTDNKRRAQFGVRNCRGGGGGRLGSSRGFTTSGELSLPAFAEASAGKPTTKPIRLAMAMPWMKLRMGATLGRNR